MWILEFFHHTDIIQLYVEVLIDGFEGSTDGDVVFELDDY